jgi:hypothetical protein
MRVYQLDDLPVHILMKYSDRLGFVSDTVKAHQDVIKTAGYVWFGKIGRRLGREPFKAINRQCAEGIPTYLFLVQKAPGGYSLARGVIKEIATSPPAKCYPEYYSEHKLHTVMRVWVKLVKLEKIKDANAELQRLYRLGSSDQIMNALTFSMNPMFAVTRRP